MACATPAHSPGHHRDRCADQPASNKKAHHEACGVNDLKGIVTMQHCNHKPHPANQHHECNSSKPRHTNIQHRTCMYTHKQPALAAGQQQPTNYNSMSTQCNQCMHTHTHTAKGPVRHHTTPIRLYSSLKQQKSRSNPAALCCRMVSHVV
jgi:hypothetical protein